MLRSILKSSPSRWSPALSSASSAKLYSSKKSSSSSSSKSSKSSKSSSKNKQSKSQTPDNKKPKKPSKRSAGDAESATASDADSAAFDEAARARRLAFEENDDSLDVGPEGRPLFTTTPTLSLLSHSDACSYFKLKKEELRDVLPEGLPMGMAKEFEEALRCSVLVRQSFLDLRDNFRRVLDPTISVPKSKGAKVRKQIVLDGKVSCGKSIALAMLVHWARDEGWLVFYVPEGQKWTHNGFFYKNPATGLWDTPGHAETILQTFLKYNEKNLKRLPCQKSDPIPLGEGAGVGLIKDGTETMALPENSSLYDLIDIGIKHTHASVGALVRLREELALVKDVPVLIAIDQYNSWFTFSNFREVVTDRSTRQIHARELATVNAFRSMNHNVMMVGAFSHKTGVGKLREFLPDVPEDARVILPRYSLDEAATVSYYYLRQRLVTRESFSDEGWKKMYYLSAGNGLEMRRLMPFMQWRLEDTPYADSPYAKGYCK